MRRAEGKDYQVIEAIDLMADAQLPAEEQDAINTCCAADALKAASEVFGFPTAQPAGQIDRVMSLVDATRLCHGTEDTAGVKRLLQRYGRKPLTMKDFRLSGPEVRIKLRQLFLQGRAAACRA
jgi:hypothetical protein